MATWEVLLVALRWSRALFRGRCCSSSSSSMPTVTSSSGDDMAGKPGGGRGDRESREQRRWRCSSRDESRGGGYVLSSSGDTHMMARRGLHTPTHGILINYLHCILLILRKKVLLAFPN